MRKKWIKIYVDQSLRGTMMDELTPAQRWVWFGLLLMAGDSTIEGVVFSRKDVSRNPIGFSDAAIAENLGVTIREYRTAKAKMIQYEKIEIGPKGAIKIVNWKKYQSEYQRQKQYRTEESDK